jgi:intein-encoded DNA endonuclease-like protein
MRETVSHKIIRKYGVPVKDFLEKRYWQDLQSCTKIADELGVTHVVVLRLMKKLGIKRRSNSASHQGELNHQFGKSHKKYGINEKFFDNHSKKMWWLVGVIAADGCVEDRYHYSIAQKDAQFLKQISRLIGYNGPIQQHGNGVYRLRVSNTYQVNKLIQLGITPRKSLTFQMPNMPSMYFWHFLRGYFDGDGSVYRSCPRVKGRTYRQWWVSFIGSDAFINALNQKLAMYLSLRKRKIETYNNTAIIRYSRKSALTILEKIYSGSSPQTRLERKYNRYLQMRKDLL